MMHCNVWPWTWVADVRMPFVVLVPNGDAGSGFVPVFRTRLFAPRGARGWAVSAGVVVEAVSWSSFPMQEGEQAARACRESCGTHGHSLR